MDLTAELDQVVGLLSFLIKLGCYYIPTLIGATVSYCAKHSKKDGQNRNRRNQKKHRIASFFTAIGRILAYSVTPAFLVTAICSLLSSNIGDSTIVYGIAFLGGAIGEDITMAFTSLRSLNRITTRVSENVQSLKGVAAMTNAMMPEGEELPMTPANNSNTSSNTTSPTTIQTQVTTESDDDQSGYSDNSECVVDEIVEEE